MVKILGTKILGKIPIKPVVVDTFYRLKKIGFTPSQIAKRVGWTEKQVKTLFKELPKVKELGKQLRKMK